MINVINMYEDNPTSDQLIREYAEAVDIIPALHKYQADHNGSNLRKLCVEVLEFCDAIYASTQSDKEREIFNSVLSKIKK